ncbi:MAG: S8 family peptidase [Peptococcaceae bacterium]|nr:S8 family peptidase [Peptococcaceae bacterium]
MYHFSMIKLVRRHPTKLDRELKEAFINLYRPFRWVPCFMHNFLEKTVKNVKKHSVIIEFHDDALYDDKVSLASSVIKKKWRSEIKHHYPSFSSCSAVLTPAAIEALLDNHGSVKKIHTDRKVRALLDIARSAIKADVLHSQAIKGEGITIAVVDTGIYPHQDLLGRIKAFKDFVKNKTNPYDDNGHGTHCAGDAAGDGAASNGLYTGIAPKASLVGVKVLDRMGSGSLSSVMSGIQWCIDNQKLLNINVLSLSLGSSATVPAADDPMVKAVEAAWDAGIIVCVAAGNEGPDEKTISSPGISPKVITVGAMDDENTKERVDDQAADFSSRGPTVDGLVKPDVISPGVNIVSLRSPNSYLDKLNKANRVANNYFSLSGTSMATPICAGVAALILQVHPDLLPDDVKKKLMETAENWKLSPYVQGAGYIQAEKAI